MSLRGKSLLLYRNVITSPFRDSTLAASLALASVYVMIVWSWINWNRTMELRPYDSRPKRLVGRMIEQSERFRLYSDLAIGWGDAGGAASAAWNTPSQPANPTVTGRRASFAYAVAPAFRASAEAFCA